MERKSLCKAWKISPLLLPFGNLDMDVHVTSDQHISHELRFYRKYGTLDCHHTKEQFLEKTVNLLYY